MRVLVAPDSFGGTLSAVAAAHAIARGWASARPGDQVVLAPQSDGGPGFVDVLGEHAGRVRTAVVAGPLGDPVTARWLDVDGVAYLECAQACGLQLLPGPPTPDTAWQAGSAGVGQLVREALGAGARRVVVGLGGSCCTDGGRGLAQALGGVAAAARLLEGVELVAATDVENPLLGPLGAAAVFGPQKGADPATVARLEDRLRRWSAVLQAESGRAVADLPGAGAAGGLGAALLALGARRVSGAAVVAEATGQAGLLAAADLVLTGEGKFDAQSLRGKLVVALAGAAGRAGAPVVVLAGQVLLDSAQVAGAGVAAAYSLVGYCGSVERAMAQAEQALEGLAAQVASRW